MARKPLALGSWGKIRVYSVRNDKTGKPTRYRALAQFRGFDGRTKEVEASGKSESDAQSQLLHKLKMMSESRTGNSLSGSSKFVESSDLWLRKFKGKVDAGSRAPTSYDAYGGHLRRTILPVLSDVRIGELNTPFLDGILENIKNQKGAATARSCRSALSGILGLAVRYGALPFNPIRDVDRIEDRAKRQPRALNPSERDEWFTLLAQNPAAIQADLLDLTKFMLATGARIAETLGTWWSDINFEAREVDINHQIVRLRGQGLKRVPTKSRAGTRVLALPDWCMEMLENRVGEYMGSDSPIFANSHGKYRDPSNTQRNLRAVRAPAEERNRKQSAVLIAQARTCAGLIQSAAADRLGWPTSRISLIERSIISLTPDMVRELCDLYNAPQDTRSELERVASSKVDRVEDALSWVTCHAFRKTTATILDEAGHSARQIADQLGHAKVSMTQDVYMGRRAKNPAAAGALESALRDLR